MANKYLKVIVQVDEGFVPELLNTSVVTPASNMDVLNRLINLFAKISGGARDAAVYVTDLSSGTQGSGTITGSTVVNGDTVTIAGITFTAGTQFAVGGSDAITMQNLVNTLTLAGYGNLFTISIEDNVVTLVPRLVGPAGFLGLAATGGLSVSGATFSGGSLVTNKNMSLGLAIDATRPVG